MPTHVELREPHHLSAREAEGGESTASVVAAVAANLGIALAKAVAAWMTGSSAMTSEAIHSLVDAGNGTLLLVGMRRSRKAANAAHPFGYAHEIYFWILVVAVLVFALGGGFSILEGVQRLIDPRPLGNPTASYVVLGIALLFEGISWRIAFKAFRAETIGTTVWAAIRATKDPTVVAVLLEDTAALVGLSIAFVGTIVGQALHNVYADGIASVLIGFVLCSVAIILIVETRSLIVGESASPQTVEGIRTIVRADANVEQIARMLTMHIGPNEILLTLDLAFRPGLSLDELVATIDRVHDAITRTYPTVVNIFIEAGRLRSAKP